MEKRKLRGMLLFLFGPILILIGMFCVFTITPSAEWDNSPEKRIISVFPLMEGDYSYIRPVQVWGDGRIVWVSGSPGSPRKVMVGYLPPEEIKRILSQVKKSGFYKALGEFKTGAPSITYLEIHLKNASHSEAIDPEDETLWGLVRYLESGAGATPQEYVPKSGLMYMIPVEELEPTADKEPYYQWPDEKFQDDLGSIYHHHEEIFVQGERLDFAWQVVNSGHPIVESNGKVYWIGLHIPEIGD